MDRRGFLSLRSGYAYSYNRRPACALPDAQLGGLVGRGMLPHATCKPCLAFVPVALGGRLKVAWFDKLQRMKERNAAERIVDPWRLRLERLRGKVDYDGLERISSQTLLDL